MRVIGYINHPSLKISVFQNGNRFSVKFEDGPIEQIYKFDDGQNVESLADVKNLVDEPFLRKVENQMEAMKHSRAEVLERFLSPLDEEEFEEII